MSTIRQIGLSPPVAFCVFLVLACGIYSLSGAVAARGEEHPGKHRPYACGEDLLPPEAQLAYHAFFRLGLLFIVLHLATLVVSTMSVGSSSQRIAVAYLLGIGVSVFVLTEEEM